MTTVTLTTDFGKNNHIIASLKGAILSSTPDCQFIEVSNEINNFDIIQGTFMLSNSYSFFPQNTIHLIAINSYYAKRVRILLLKKDGYYFIAPDNGILSIMFEETEQDNFRYIEYGKTIGDLYLNIASFISDIQSKTNIEDIGTKATSIIKRISLKPVVSGDSIRATVIFIDKFGNAILNVTKDLFDRVKANRNFKLFYGPKESLNKIRYKYSDVPFGDELCLFNSAKHMEIAVNMGNASEMLGIENDSTLQIVFE